MNSNKLDAELHKKLSTLSVLVVDDSEFDREVLAATLRKIGINNIQIAENGSVAASKMENAYAIKKPFHIIFLDSKMPTQNGISLLKWIRSQPRFKYQTIIVTTGTSDFKDINQFIDLGADGFVIKPVTLEILQAKIFQALALGILTAS